MLKEEVKIQINKALEGAPDDVLESILDYLKELLSKSRTEAMLSSNLNRILQEDEEVLEKCSK